MAVDGPVFGDAWQADYRITFIQNFLKNYKVKYDLSILFRFMRGQAAYSLWLLQMDLNRSGRGFHC